MELPALGEAFGGFAETKNMSVKIKMVSTREQIAVTVFRPFWQEFLQY